MTKAEDDRAYYLRNKERIKARTNAYYHANKETALAKQKERYDADKAVVLARNKAWADANRGKMRGYHSNYVKRNRDLWCAQTQKYRAAKKTAIPAWADEGAIRGVYVLATVWNELWPEDPVHVDHIVPLQSKIVTGLHCEANLKICRAFDNRTKSNKYWPNKP